MCLGSHDITWRKLPKHDILRTNLSASLGSRRDLHRSTQIAVDPGSTTIAHVCQGQCEFVCKSLEQPDKMSGQPSCRKTRLTK